MTHVHLGLLRLAGDVRWQVAGTVALGLAVTATYVVQGALVALVLARAFDGNGLGDMTGLLAGVAGALVVRAGLLWAREVAAQLVAQRVKERVRGRVYDHLLALGPGYLLRQRTGDVQTTLVEGIEALETYFGRYLPTVGVCLLGPLLILGYLAWLDLPLTLLIGCFVVFVPLAPRIWDRIIAEKSEARWQAWGELASDYVDAMQGMTTLKAFNAVQRTRDALAGRARHLYETTMRQLGMALLDTGLTTFGVLAGTAAAIGIGAVRVASGTLELVTLFTVLLLARECFRPFADLSKYWHIGFEGLSSSKNIVALLDTEPEVAEPAEPVSLSASELVPRIDLDGVTFTYSTRGQPALRDLSLLVAPGETVAVVGPSGAGKTTIISLLLRFFDPQAGVVRLGGYDVRDLPLTTVRAATAVVSQDTYLFYGTIADNIRLGRPEATDAEVEAAARQANIHEFIAGLPDDYATQVSERGGSLSGGQRQRVAIARALLKDAPILVLDEATSNVDAASEAAIQQALDRVSAGRTTLVIAHRLSTVRNADRIVVLADGTATETGRHGELLARNGDYARLVAAQESIRT
ncbi:MAG: ABC transporter ATP-binding protein [Egibacteraceae bacterium]